MCMRTSLDALPPSMGRSWQSTTFAPRRAAANAAVTPAGPPPATSTSQLRLCNCTLISHVVREVHSQRSSVLFRYAHFCQVLFDQTDEGRIGGEPRQHSFELLEPAASTQRQLDSACERGNRLADLLEAEHLPQFNDPRVVFVRRCCVALLDGFE